MRQLGPDPRIGPDASSGLRSGLSESAPRSSHRLRASESSAGRPGRLGLNRVLPRPGIDLAIWILVVISISRIHNHFGFLSSIRPAAALLALSLLLLPLNLRRISLEDFRTYPGALAGALVVVACLSVPFGLSIGNSGKFLLDDYFRMLAVYVLVALVMRGTRELSQFLWAFLVGVAILSWLAIFVFDLGQGAGAQMRLSDLYMYDSNDLGVLLLMGIPLTLVAMDTSGRAGRFFGFLLLVGIGVSIARTGSRGAFVGLVGLGGAFFFWARHISIARRLGAVIAITTALLVAAPPGYWDQMNSLKDPTQDYNWEAESGRRQLAKRGFGYMLRYPLTGVGVSNFSKAEWQISSMASEVGRRKGIPGKAAHNTWVQIGAETGVTGLVVWVLFVVGTMVVVARTRRRLPESWKRGPPDRRLLYSLSFYLPLAIWAFAVPSTFVSHAYMDPMYYLATMSAGYLVAVRRALGDSRAVTSEQARTARA